MMSILATNRLFKLLKRDVYINKSAILITSITIAAILLLYNLISPFNIHSINNHPSMYYLILFLGGIWVTSACFRDVHDKKQAYFLLTLPASSLEKWLSRLLLTSVGFAVGALVVYSVIYWVIGLLTSLIFRQHLVLFNPFNPTIWRYILQYAVLQSVFFLGAIYFKKHSLIKTILALCLIGIVLTIFGFFISLFTFKHIFMHFFIFPNFSDLHLFSFASTLYLLIWALITPCCWLVSYQRLKECEDR